MIIKRLWLTVFLFIFTITSWADNDSEMLNYAVSGHITDSKSGEDLIGATVYVEELGTGAVTNVYGFYALNLAPGTYNLVFSYIGYTSQKKKIDLEKDITLNIELDPGEQMLNEVQVVAERKGEVIKKPEMSVAKLQAKTIKKIPAFFGEVDVIKAIQLLPGVQFTSEGSIGFSVRGGSPDQNLILLDEATVYNAGHLLGFFSVFNNDAVKDVKLYKGDIPARFGGRLASVLDVRMKDGNAKKLSVTGGIGLISSRLTVEAPIIKDRTTFILSGRRTYFDIFLPIFGKENVKDNKLYFYDLNGKINHKIDDKNRIYLSGYLGRDVFKNQFAKMSFGNQTATLRWNHIFSRRVFSNFTMIYSRYLYSLGTANDDEANSFEWNSNLRDAGFRSDLTYYLDSKNTIRFGFHSTYHMFEPGIAKGGENSLFTEFKQPEQHALESSIYVSNEQKFGSKFTVKYGLRYTMFNNIGPTQVYFFDKDYNFDYIVDYDKREFYNTYHGLEPRIGMNYVLDDISAIKASYSRTNQFIQLAQNSAAGTPLDVWFPASPNVKPQICDQVALGYFRNFLGNGLEASMEVYYKNMQNTIDFKDHAELLLNKEIEGELRFGKSWSYGAEFMVRLVDMPIKKGNISGWVSYTYSRTFREIEDINNGNKYPAPFDKPHDVSVVLNYDISQRLSVSANWIYLTGRPVTVPTGRAYVEGNVLPIYSDRNDFRYKDYHRMDLSLTWRCKDKGQRFKYDWNLSIYNVYNRHNTWSLNFKQDTEGNSPDAYKTKVTNVYLVGIVPSITFNFKF